MNYFTANMEKIDNLILSEKNSNGSETDLMRTIKLVKI